MEITDWSKNEKRKGWLGERRFNYIFHFLRLKKAEVEQGQTNVIDWGADCFPLAGMHVIPLSVSVRHHDNHLCVLASGNAAASCPCKQHSTLTNNCTRNAKGHHLQSEK